jgi:hypothetical protein
MPLSRGDQEGDRLATALGPQVDLGTEAPLAAAQCFIRMLSVLRSSCSRCMLVRSDNRPVYMMESPVQFARRVGLLLQGLQDVVPDLGPLPAVEPAGDGFPRTIPFWEIPPGCSGAQQPEDGVNDDPMVFVRPSGMRFPWWQERLQPLPLVVCKVMSRHTQGYDEFADRP